MPNAPASALENMAPASSHNLPPLPSPPLPLTPAQQEKLEKLLQLYRADQITPEEYHLQRAKILGGQ
jgi:hypothetical protein